MIVIFSVVMTLVVIFGAEPLLNTYTLDDSVRKHAHEYLVILGGFGAVFAFNLLQSSILKAYGYTKDAMFISITANIVNVIGNAAALYSALWSAGTAAYPVLPPLRYFLNLLPVFCLPIKYKKPDVYFSLKGIAQVPAKIIKQSLPLVFPQQVKVFRIMWHKLL